MNKQEARRLLQKYRLNQCTPEEKAWVEQWYLELAGKEILPQTDTRQQRKDVWKGIRSNISQSRNYYMGRQSWTIAATVIFLLGIGYMLFQNRKLEEHSIGPLRYSLIKTENGELKKITLPDGSQICLNGGSRLRYSNLFNVKNREVILEEGEVFFDIKHDSEKPFLVYSGKAKTQVLGTAFSVRAYNALGNIQVTVARGKVGVMKDDGKNSDLIFLLPNEQVTMDKNDERFVKKQIPAVDFTNWTEGKLQFKNESLSDIAFILEKKFNTPIEITDKQLTKLRFSAGFEARDGLNDILDILCLAENLTYQKKGGKIMILPGE